MTREELELKLRTTEETLVRLKEDMIEQERMFNEVLSGDGFSGREQHFATQMDLLNEKDKELEIVKRGNHFYTCLMNAVSKYPEVDKTWTDFMRVVEQSLDDHERFELFYAKIIL